MKIIVSLLLATCFQTAFAETPETTPAPTPEEVTPHKPLKALLTLGADFGGDTLVTIKYTDGSSADFTAGKGITSNIGLLYSPISGDHQLHLQAAAGLKFSINSGRTITGDTQSITYLRFPLELLGFYFLAPARLRVGGGVTYHLFPKISADGVLATGTVKFDNAFGYVAQIEYIHPTADADFAIGLRYVGMNMRIQSGPEVSASSIGLVLSLLL